MQKEHNQAILSPSPSVGKKKSSPLLSFKQKQTWFANCSRVHNQIDLDNMKSKKRNKKAGQNFWFAEKKK